MFKSPRRHHFPSGQPRGSQLILDALVSPAVGVSGYVPHNFLLVQTDKMWFASLMRTADPWLCSPVIKVHNKFVSTISISGYTSDSNSVSGGPIAGTLV